MAAGVSISSLRVVGFTCLSLLLVETAGLKGVPYHVTDLRSSDTHYYVAGVEVHQDVSLSRQRRQILSSQNESSISEPPSTTVSTPTTSSPSTLAPTSKPSTTPLPSTTTTTSTTTVTTTTTIPPTTTISTTTSTTTEASTPSLPPSTTSSSTMSVRSTTPSESPNGEESNPTSTESTETTEKVNVVEEKDHKYYTTKVVAGDEATRLWTDLSSLNAKGVTKHSTLSDSHRTAATTQISFMFPFYGHQVKQVTIATGGFIYMSDFLHQWLTATQYIAPLMANFDTEIGDNSHIYYADNGTTFVVQWDSVYLQDHQKGAFSFQASLHKSGRIMFVYKSVPVKLSTVPTQNHPVKIGVSDAYYEDKDVTAKVRRRTIYEYNRVSINFEQIGNNTAVIINPNPTCTAIKDCEQCIMANISFECQWCPDAGRCSDGLDRKRQDWLQRRCHKTEFKAVDECHKYPFRSQDNSIGGGSGAKSRKQKAAAGSGTKLGIGPIIIIILVIALLILVVGWFVFAYMNPTSRSGMWLIEHRPSMLKAKLNKVRFWKRGGDAGEKYEVSMQPEGESVA